MKLFKCNLCMEESEPKNILAMVFGLKIGQPIEQYYLTKRIEQSDNHICIKCVSLINSYKENKDYE